MSRALAAFLLDPLAFGGLWIRARLLPGPDDLAKALAALPLPQRRIHPGLGDAALDGGLDLAFTLQAGRAIQRPGLLSNPAVLVLPMAERCPPRLAARLGQAIDARTHAVVALDESAGPEEGLPPALAARLGLFLIPGPLEPLPDLGPARARLPRIRFPEPLFDLLGQAAEALGTLGLRGLLATVTCARALAALDGVTEVTPELLTEASGMTLAHLAPPPAPEPPQDKPNEPPQADQQADQQAGPQPDGPADGRPGTPDLADLVVAAARASLPPGLLAELAQRRVAGQGTQGAGQQRIGNRAGRPLAARPGKPATVAALDLLASLRAAAPWQAMRRQDSALALILRPSDLRIRQRQERSDRLVIFAVDASGSSAVARLAEAKGAVELFLAEAYVRRDHVCLIAFRHERAELVLPPTRSLARTKARLAGLPGGGGTPLASGLDLGLQMALQARRRGMTPTLALLTDGRGNIARDGTPGRAGAEADAQAAARAIRTAGLACLVLDMATRPQPELAALAAGMGARYRALPRAQAGQLAGQLAAALMP